MKRLKFIDAVLLAFALTCVISITATLIADYAVPSTGNIKTCNVELYWDAELTAKATEVDWGLVEPVAPVTKTLYIRNGGSVDVKLSFYVSDWSPSNAAEVLSVEWNLEGQTLAAGETKTVTLTLYSSMDMQNVTSFSNILRFVGIEII